MEAAMKILYVVSVIIALCVAAWSGEEYKTIIHASELSRYVDRQVRVTGQISNIPWQHMIASVKGYPYDHYFDFDDYQIVIYVKEKIAHKGTITVYGTVVEVGGDSKNPRRKETAVEYHIRVDTWEKAD
jgi:hypothetical protein